MNEPFCECGHPKLIHLKASCPAYGCSCLAYIPHPTPTLRDQFAMALGPAILSYIFEMRPKSFECSAVAEGLWNQIDAIMAAREKKS